LPYAELPFDNFKFAQLPFAELLFAELPFAEYTLYRFLRKTQFFAEYW
jgi:hypothetical protein